MDRRNCIAWKLSKMMGIWWEHVQKTLLQMNIYSPFRMRNQIGEHDLGHGETQQY